MLHYFNFPPKTQRRQVDLEDPNQIHSFAELENLKVDVRVGQVAVHDSILLRVRKASKALGGIFRGNPFKSVSQAWAPDVIPLWSGTYRGTRVRDPLGDTQYIPGFAVDRVYQGTEIPEGKIPTDQYGFDSLPTTTVKEIEISLAGAGLAPYPENTSGAINGTAPRDVGRWAARALIKLPAEAQ